MTLGVLALFVLMAYGQEKKFALYSVAFYNMENLFDTIHDEGKNDYEYLPNGTNQWNTMKYKAKLKNMSEILSLLSTDKLPMGPAIIGVSEIENYRVLEDILKQPALADRGYRYVHYEGEDQRGVDCAFFYNPKLFELTNSKLVPYVYINDTVHKTRGFLIASGNIADEKMHFIVNHWPSRAAAGARNTPTKAPSHRTSNASACARSPWRIRWTASSPSTGCCSPHTASAPISPNRSIRSRACTPSSSSPASAPAPSARTPKPASPASWGLLKG